ncbi:hypothetical protein [Mariniflexile fucanivorans]|nr:hypothetical protein [Mariniflexile fucanivorans]
MAIIINNVGFDSFKSSLPTSSEAMALRGLAESFDSIPIEDFEKEHKAIANKRISRQKKGLRNSKIRLSHKSKPLIVNLMISGFFFIVPTNAIQHIPLHSVKNFISGKELH